MRQHRFVSVTQTCMNYVLMQSHQASVETRRNYQTEPLREVYCLKKRRRKAGVRVSSIIIHYLQQLMDNQNITFSSLGRLFKTLLHSRSLIGLVKMVQALTPARLEMKA